MIIWQLLSIRVNLQFISLVNIPIVIIHQVYMAHISVASEKLDESLTTILIHLIISISLLDLKPRHFIDRNILGIFTHCPLKICSESIKTCSFKNVDYLQMIVNQILSDCRSKCRSTMLNFVNFARNCQRSSCTLISMGV